MTLHVVPLGGPVHPAVRLKEGAVAVPALASHVRPALVLAERETREVLAAAGRQDVGVGGRFSAGPAGVQLWNGPFDGPNGLHGSAQHLGSVDWSYDTPTRHYITVYRVLVTTAGQAAGESPETLLTRVLALAGVQAPGDALRMPPPPQRDPFRADSQRSVTVLPD